MIAAIAFLRRIDADLEHPALSVTNRERERARGVDGDRVSGYRRRQVRVESGRGPIIGEYDLATYDIRRRSLGGADYRAAARDEQRDEES